MPKRPLPVGEWTRRRNAGIQGRGPWWEQRALEGSDRYAEWERFVNPAIYNVTRVFVGRAYEVGGEAEVARRVNAVVRFLKDRSRAYARGAGLAAAAVPIAPAPVA